jgi:hypothetical protein
MSADVIIERVVRVTPLGLRFWDAVTNAAVGQGLTVEAYPQGQPFQRVASFLTIGGFHAFRNLPGMHDIESGQVALGAAIGRPFVIEVSDPTLRRFLPFSITTDLPVQGLFPWLVGPTASPLGSPPGSPPVPLFSLPSRPVPTGMAAVRADLWDAVADTAANGALLEVSAPGVPATVGMADEQGRVMVVLPYPEPPPPLLSHGSPLSGSGPLSQQAWPVRLRVCYEPRPTADFPDLSRALRQQPANLQVSLGTNQAFMDTTFRFGQDLIAQTQNAPLSRLYVTATAASPP